MHSFGSSSLLLRTVRQLPLLAGLFCLALLTTRGSAASQPNLVIFYADDLGWGEVSCQGFAQDIPTPNIDSIARNGIRFTNGYVAATYCLSLIHI